MTITLDIARDLERRILQEAQARGIDAESYVVGLLQESLGATAEEEVTEGELLEEINQGFPADLWSRYRELIARRRAESLSPKEHAELVALIDRVETANARRIECLAKLADLRQVPLKSLMADMGIQPSVNA